MNKIDIPIWKKSYLTMQEASILFNIGIHKLRQLTDDEASECVLWLGSKRLINREAMQEFLDNSYSI